MPHNKIKTNNIILEVESYKNILKLAFPVVLAQAAIYLSSIINLVFIRHFGFAAIASVGVSNVVYNTITSFGEGFLVGTSVLVAGYYSTKDYSNLFKVTTINLVIAIIVGLVVVCFSDFLSTATFHYMSHGNLASVGTVYMHYWLLTVIFTFIIFVIEGHFRGLHDTITPLIIFASTSILLIILDYALIFGHFGFHKYGFYGAGVASFFSYMISCIIAITLFVLHKKNREIFKISTIIKQVQDYIYLLKPVLKLIWDIGFYTGFMVVALIIFVYILGTINSTDIAIHQVVFQIFLFSYLSSIGFLAASAVIISRFIGKNRMELIVPSIKRICKISFGFISVLSILLFIFAKEISVFFISNKPSLVLTSIKCLHLVAVAQLCTSVYMVIRGALTGACDTTFVSIAGLLSSYLLFLPLTYLLAIYFHYGIIGGYLAFLFWTITDASVFLYRFFVSKKWRNKALVTLNQ